MLTDIDHLVVLVPKLHEAMSAYAELGFAVTPGGEHPVGTHNALIPFADGSYIELIAFRDPGRPHDHRWWPFLASGGGLVDFALSSDDLTEDMATLAARALSFVARDAGRLRPDGRRIAWRAADPPSGASAPLPFLIQDITPRSLRVPGGAAFQHRLGAAGTARVYVAANDLDAAGAAYAALPGISSPQPAQDALFGISGLSLRCGAARIVLLPWAAVVPQLPASVQRRGPGIVAVALSAPGPAAGRWLDVSGTLGAMLHVGKT